MCATVSKMHAMHFNNTPTFVKVRVSSESSNISVDYIEKWTVRVWASEQKHLPKDSVVKKIREKKQHKHGITMGPLVTQRS